MQLNHRIQTFSGLEFSYSRPLAESIDVRDVARSLSFTCRFRGHTRFFYSVAQHCLACAAVAPDELKLPALLHELGETYTGDNPSPMKVVCPEVKELEEHINRVGIPSLGVLHPHPRHAQLKIIDWTMMLTEADVLLRKPLSPVWNLYFFQNWAPMPNVRIEERNFYEVENEFLETYSKLSGVPTLGPKDFPE